ncbi:MAG: DMT family transporter [Fusobacteriaceae bacterium]
MEFKGYFFSLLAGVIWGFIGIFGTKLNQIGFTGNEITFLRLFFAAIFGLLYIGILKKKLSAFIIPQKLIKHVFIIGIVTQGLMNIFLFISIIRVGTITATMLLCSGPIFTIFLSAFILKEKITLEKYLALSFSILGAILVITEGHISNIKFDFIGVACGAISGLLYGFYPILGKRVGKSGNPILITIYSFLVASLFLLPFLNIGALTTKIISFKAFLLAAGFGLFPTFIAYLLFVKALRYTTASKASIISMVEVPATAIVGVFFLNESFNTYKFLGIILVLIGIYITKLDIISLILKLKKKYINL